MFKRKVRRRPVVRKRVKYPQIRANPQGFCLAYKFSRGEFEKTLKSWEKVDIYEFVKAFTTQISRGDNNKTIVDMNTGLTNQGQNDQYKKGLILLACFFGLMGEDDAAIGSFGSSAEYFSVASKFIQKCLKGEVPAESGDPFAYWKGQYKNAKTDSDVTAVVPTNWEIPSRGGAYSPDLGDMWSTTQQQRETPKRGVTKAQIKALKDRMKVLLSDFNRAFGSAKGQSAKKTKRRNAYLPFVFNLELRTRTAPLPAVVDYMDAKYIGASTSQINNGEDMRNVLQPDGKPLSTIKALLVVARLNGNAQVFISTKNPVSVPTYRKFASEYEKYSADLKYWVPIVEMKTFQEGPLLDSLARGPALAQLDGKVTPSGYAFDVKAGGTTESISCCRPYTGLGAALMFARAWRVENPKNAQIPLAVFQEIPSTTPKGTMLLKGLLFEELKKSPKALYSAADVMSQYRRQFPQETVVQPQQEELPQDLFSQEGRYEEVFADLPPEEPKAPPPPPPSGTGGDIGFEETLEESGKTGAKLNPFGAGLQHFD
jgi:hypothetical protein